MNLDLKTGITIITFAITLAGFYYTTQYRLNDLEADVTVLQKKVKQIKRGRNK